MPRRSVQRCVAVAVAIASLAVAPGCDWFQGSESGARQSPFISSLSISRASVLCDQEFSVSFRYDDPQGDITSARVTLSNITAGTSREESLGLPEGSSRSNGRVSFPFTFECGSKGGVWKISVQMLDDRDHSSNVISGEIRLNAAG